MDKTKALGNEKVFRLIIEYSVPAIVGMTVNAFYNIVDRIFIGNHPELGPDGLAGITIVFPLMIILLSLGVLFGIGGATLFSLRLGENKPHEARQALGNAFFLLVVAGLTFMIIGQIFLDRLLVLFGASEAVLPYAHDYMRMIFFGAVFQVVSLGFNHFIRADGFPRIAMYTMFLGAGTNIILDPIFIYGLDLGMRGAALATVIAQGCSFTWVLVHFFGKRANYRLTFDIMRPKPAVMLKIFVLGLPGFLLQLANSLLFGILNRNLKSYGGDIAISGMGIINSLGTIFILPVIGMRQGVQPIISYNFGAAKYNRVRQAIMQAIFLATSTLILGFMVIRLFPVQLISLFNRDQALLDFGKYALQTWFLCLPLIGFQIMASSYFQAIGKSAVATFLTLTRQVIFLIPALIIFPQFWGLEGLLYAAPFADFFSAIVTGLAFFYNIRRISKEPFSFVRSAFTEP